MKLFDCANIKGRNIDKKQWKCGEAMKNWGKKMNSRAPKLPSWETWWQLHLKNKKLMHFLSISNKNDHIPR